LGHLTDESSERAVKLAESTNTALCAVLTRLGLVSEHALADVLATTLSLARLGGRELQLDPAMPSDLNPEFLRVRKLVPVRSAYEGLKLAMANPLDDEAISAVTFAYGEALKPCVALESDVDGVWAKWTGAVADALPDVLSSPQDMSEETLALADHDSDAPVIRLVNRLIGRAVALRASDIHIEPTQDALEVRFRVDGELGASEVLAKRMAEPVASRLKLMAKLDIAEKRVPQDGRLRVAVQGHPIDLRLATFPTLHGESVVLRLLGQQSVALDLAAVGLSDEGLAALRSALVQPHGLILITGPTGSGKTTTLYAALNALRRPESKLVTVEDPIEYTLPGVSQLQVKPEIGLDYPAALRSVLRNDPDIIMVGEIRDRETADIAIRAALTGHLVLATLHTNTAAGAITRLLDLGVQDFLLASTLVLTSAQRLVRRLCGACARPRPADASEAALFRLAGLQAGDTPVLQVWEPVGCPACLQRGFMGRTPVFEAILLTDDTRRQVKAGFDEQAFSRAAMGAGARTLLQHGLHKALAGETTVAEVIAVTGSEAWRASA
jgi:general secretion pathway protein E